MENHSSAIATFMAIRSNTAAPSALPASLHSAFDALWHLRLLRQRGSAAPVALPSLSLFEVVP